MSDAKVFMAGAIELLAQYPPPVIERILSPVYGLPGRHKFLPLIAEIRDACEEALEPILRQQDRERIEDEAKRLLAPPRVPRDQRPSYDDLKAKYGPNWGINQDRGDRPKWEPPPLDRVCAEAGVDPTSIKDQKRTGTWKKPPANNVLPEREE